MTESGFPVYGANGQIGYYHSYNHDEPTILITCRGATCGTLNISPPHTYVTGNAMALDNPKPEIINFKFLFYALLNRGLDDIITGAAQPQITRANLSRVGVPSPPLADQERIVKLLDKADELRKLRAQADRRTADLIPALFHDMFGNAKHSWRSSALGELVENFRYGTSNKSTGEGKPALRIPNVIQEAVNLDDLKFVPVSDSEFDRLRLKDGDLLFVRTNGNADNVGRCAVFDARAIKAAGYNAEEFIYASYLIRARLQPERVTPLFVQHFLACPEGCRALRARSKTSAGQFNINTEGLGTIPIPVPPLPLQYEFAARVSEIRAVQANQTTSHRQLDDLFASLLHRAFNGQL